MWLSCNASNCNNEQKRDFDIHTDESCIKHILCINAIFTLGRTYDWLVFRFGFFLQQQVTVCYNIIIFWETFRNISTYKFVLTIIQKLSLSYCLYAFYNRYLQTVLTNVRKYVLVRTVVHGLIASLQIQSRSSKPVINEILLHSSHSSRLHVQVRNQRRQQNENKANKWDW